MTRVLKKVWNFITGILVALVVLLAIALVGVRLVGLRTYVVLSGSMEPTYPTGSLIYVKEVDTSQLKAGDVITFMIDEDTIATHRIIEVLPDEEDSSVIRFRTQGDANDSPDGSPVHYKNVIGTPVFCVPKLGYVANFIQNPPGKYLAFGFGAILLVLVFLPDLIGDDDKEKEKKKKEKE
ncbi:MAG: signal peptidase I [Erysipelotrichaceae bacterium]